MRGLTLLELLVSMTVLATVMAILYGAYGSGVEAVRIARDQGEMRQSARMILERMSMELQCATVTGGGPFVGERDEIEGRAAARLDFNTFYGRGGGFDLFRISYGLADDPEQDGLILSCIEEAVIGPGNSMGIRSYELATAVAALDITYYDDQGRRFERWNSGEGEHLDRLPSFIAIRLTLGSPSGEEQAFATGIHSELAGPGGEVSQTSGSPPVGPAATGGSAAGSPTAQSATK